MPEAQSPNRSSRWQWVAGIWLAFALFDASQNVLVMHKEGRHHSWLPLFLTEVALWVPWALATPFISRIAPRRWIVHLVIFTTLSSATEAWSAFLQVMFNPWGNRRPPEFLDTWVTSLLYQALTFLIVYALILTVTALLEWQDRMARQMTAAAILSEELIKAQLAALRRQIEPHFMFNTLNAIAGLVRGHRNDTAVSMIVGLSEFLRRASENSHRPQVTLEEEVEYLQRYVEIQQVRFGDRLQVSLDIPAELLRAQVPNLLLQPLVENAIKHGISKRVAGGAVRIAGECDQGNLRLSIYNEGPQLPADWQATHTGVGIGNLRTRLHILHGDQSELSLQPVATGGMEVTVTLPFKEA